MSVAELSAVILKTILASAVEVGAGVLPEDVLGELGDQLASMLNLSEMGVGDIEGLGRQAAEMLGAPVDELTDQARGAVDDAVGGVRDAVGEQADRARDRLGGLLGGGEKDEPSKEEPPAEEPKDPG